jgi:hypothetical protein
VGREAIVILLRVVGREAEGVFATSVVGIAIRGDDVLAMSLEVVD